MSVAWVAADIFLFRSSLRSEIMFLKTICLVLPFYVLSCVKTPTACFTQNVAGDTITLGQTVLFDAGCSKLATGYYWVVDTADAQDVVIHYAIGQEKHFSHTFNRKGKFRVGLTVNRKNQAGNSDAKIFVVK